MKNTFKSKREKVNGYYPYIVYISGVKYCMFETGKQMPYKHILDIRQRFKSENLCFATTCNELWRFFAIDTADVYELHKDHPTPLFYYDVTLDTFYETEVKEFNNQRNVELTDKVAKIERL